MDVVDLVAAAEFVDDVVDEGEVFEDELARGDFLLFAEVDQLAVEAVADGAELVLHQQGAGVLAVVLVAGVEAPELAGGGLDERGDGDGLVGAQRDVADADFDGVEEGMRADVPPDFFGVVDAVGLDEQVDVAFELGVAGEAVGKVGAGEVFEDLGAVALVAGLHAEPEGRVGGEREDVGEEVAHRVHDADGGFAVFDADVDVEAEDEVGAGDELEVFDDLGVARVGIDLLDAPVGEGMGGAGDEDEVVLFGEGDHVAAEVEEVFLGVLDVAADAGADLDDGLVHLGLDALFEAELALGEHLGRDVRAQIAGHRVDGLVFLFDAEREGWAHVCGLVSEYKNLTRIDTIERIKADCVVAATILRLI